MSSSFPGETSRPHIVSCEEGFNIVANIKLISFLNNTPVNNFPKFGQVVGTAVLIIQIVRVFPYVESQNRSKTFCYRVTCIRFLCDE